MNIVSLLKIIFCLLFTLLVGDLAFHHTVGCRASPCKPAFLYLGSSRPVSQQSDLGGCNGTSSMAVIKDYYALKENEICVSQGEVVQVLAVNQQNMCLVYQPASDHSPAAEGWVPGSILAPLTKATAAAENSDGSIK